MTTQTTNNPREREYTTPQIASILGRTVHKTISYIRRGYMSPSVQDASGPGSRRLWSYQDVVRMLMVSHLEKLGFGVPMMRWLSSHMDERHIEELKVWEIDLREADEENTDVLLALGGRTVRTKPYGDGSHIVLTISEEEHEMRNATVRLAMSDFHNVALDRIGA